MYMPSVALPDAPVAKWTAIRKNSAQGLFAYRQMQAIDLLEIPDYGGGDLNAKQRRDALHNAVNFQKPLAALSIFLGVVALEDFVRDFGARLADNSFVSSLFPELANLRSKPIPRGHSEAFPRLDTDPFGVVDPADINALFRKALSIEPIPVAEYPRLRDLALIRHTVAHHAVVIRAVDVPRFQYYIVRPNQPVNPPIDFVREVLQYLYQIGRRIEVEVRHRVFGAALSTFSSDWATSTPSQLIDLIEFFDYFGFIESTIGPVGYAEPGTELHDRMKREAGRIKEMLLGRCIQELLEHHARKTEA